MNQDWLKYEPYALEKGKKHKLLLEGLRGLTEFHALNCSPYSNIIDAEQKVPNEMTSISDFPFIPVRLFKLRELKSIPDEDVVKTLTSSGTSGQAVSKIFLDKTTALLQTKVLTKIVSSYIGTKRVPMLILDSEEVVQNRSTFSARGAGILGFSMFGSKRFYAFDKEMCFKETEVLEFLEQHRDEQIFLFGFTFIVYAYFLQSLEKLNTSLDLSKAILIHGGGWKKLIDQAITNEDFKRRLKITCGISQVYDYYGMVEQTGSIFMECEAGYLHAPVYADVIIRRPKDFTVADFGELGLIQVISLIPTSYPGHSLLTEDEGIIYGEDNCLCGRLGKYFKISGRIKMAEIRGCSDTFEGRI